MAGLAGAVVGAGPDDALVVGVAPAGPEVTVVELAAPALRVVAVVLEEPGGAVGPGWVAGTVVAVVSAVAAVELVVAPGAPALANSPPRRNDGGPLWNSL
ncbi:MAG TPA: hypothetical protein VGR20_09250 [Acidimicrobiia bacterium]|nr:hypothetical protein [Acidimicrobiia bacterium]